MPESLEVTLTTVGDFRQKAEAVPGVSDVHVRGTSFWAGRTDVAVRLCGQRPVDEGSRCAERGAAIAEEKAAVFQALRTMEGVGDIYLEEHAHAVKDALWVTSGSSEDVAKRDRYVPESFHLVLDAPDAAERVKRVVGGLPGVRSVDKELG
ncbi:hypothetical protein ABZU32_35345 [Sphaerisporangium sp. NPDC005288]|uniref:hypothetical protein n=1 Tax=Sphaerisporangium sp. NPDC005288 TaxID=3155114 RepID=UPI00339F34D9